MHPIPQKFIIVPNASLVGTSLIPTNLNRNIANTMVVAPPSINERVHATADWNKRFEENNRKINPMK